MKQYRAFCEGNKGMEMELEMELETEMEGVGIPTWT